MDGFSHTNRPFYWACPAWPYPPDHRIKLEPASSPAVLSPYLSATCNFSDTCTENTWTLLKKEKGNCKQNFILLWIPLSTHYLATSLRHQMRAKSSGVCPTLSLADTSAPACTRISVQSRRPSEAARCSGVDPESVVLETPEKKTLKNFVFSSKWLSSVSL